MKKINTLNSGTPKKAGTYLFFRTAGKAAFRKFDGRRFGEAAALPWDAAPVTDNSNHRLRVVNWLPCIDVPAPTKAEIKAGKPGPWRSTEPESAGVYRVLSRLPDGTRDITTYKVWTGNAWGPNSRTPYAAVLSCLAGPVNGRHAHKVVWQELDAVEMRMLAAIELPVDVADIHQHQRAGEPGATTTEGLALDFVRRNPGAHAIDVGLHLGEVAGKTAFYAQTMHSLHKRKLVYREMSLSAGGPSFRYYAAGPSLVGVKGRRIDDVLLTPSENGQLVISGKGGKFLLGPRELAMLRAKWLADGDRAAD